MSHTATAPAQAEYGKQHTPDVTKAKSVTVFVILAIIIAILLVATVAWIKHTKKQHTSNSPEQHNSSKNSASTSTTQQATHTYNLLKSVKLGDILTITVAPGESAHVLVTNEWCPSWSSSPIDVYDQNGTLRTLDGARFVQGPATADNITCWIYQNNSQNSITIKTGRCKSMEDCSIVF